MQSLGLILVLTLLNFMCIILAITLHLGRILTKKLFCTAYKNRSTSTSCEK